MAEVRWGLLSTAGIGRTVVEATRGSVRARFVAVASRDAGRAQVFADECGLPSSFGSYEEMLASDEVDAVYVALPVSMHTEWTVAALAAGKHVLCEKPFATSADRVSVGTGDIRRSRALGGGSLLDLGCYCLSAVRMFAGTPERVYVEKVVDHEGDGVDLRLAATLRMPDGVLAQFDVGLDLVRRDELELIGIEGRIAVGDPWLCRDGYYIELTRDGRTERLPVDPEGRFALTGQEEDVYRIELDTTSAFITGELEPEFGREDAVEQAAVLEAIRESADTCVPVTTGGRCDLRSD